MAYLYPRWAALLLGEKARSVLRGGCVLAAHGEFAAAAVAASPALVASRAREPWKSLVFLLPLIPSPLGHQSPLLAILLLKHLSQLREESVSKQELSTWPPGATDHGNRAPAVKGRKQNQVIVTYLDTRTHH